MLKLLYEDDACRWSRAHRGTTSLAGGAYAADRLCPAVTGRSRRFYWAPWRRCSSDGSPLITDHGRVIQLLIVSVPPTLVRVNIFIRGRYSGMIILIGSILATNKEGARMAHVSQLVALEEVHNCRDLGGMPAADGRVIRPHALLRSANLHRASVRDLATLRDMGLEHVLDLRTQQERDAERDRLLVSWSVTKLPIFDEASAFPLQWRGIVEHPGTFIMDLYTVMITSQTAVDQWTRMFQLLLDEPGCYLWHCTQGKDLSLIHI